MEVLLPIVIGVLFAAGFYLMLRRSLMKVVIGVSLMTNAVNLVVFTAAGLSREGAPLLAAGESAPPDGAADPLPQAFILTAIVIGFGVLAFFVTLVMRVYQTIGTDDTDQMRATDR